MGRLPIMLRPLLISLFLTSTTLADTWTVDDDGKANFNNIQDAIDASSDGDEIIVMPGTYTGTGDEVVDMLGKSVTLRSLYPDNPDVVATTIIDGEWVRRGILCDSGETIKTIIYGFTIHNSYATGYEFFDDGVMWRLGAGMLIKDSSPGMTNCTFTSNTADDGGGGVLAGAIYGTCDSAFINCTFDSNTATWWGGGMYNEAGSIMLTNCTFINNTSGGNGGGMFDDQGQQGGNTGNATLTACTFTNNTANYGGGGMYNFESSQTLENCTFTDNTASVSTGFGGGGGGGMSNNSSSSPTLTNCTFTNNISYNDGGGMYNNYDSSSTLTECIFENNTAEQGGGIYNNYNLTLTDSRFCDNTPTHIEGEWNDLGWNLFWDVCNDCNGNGIDDFQDILDGTSLDCDNDLTPDECQYDCDDDGVPDPTELYCYQTQDDIDSDGHPDDCQADCDSDGIPDSYAIEIGIVFDCDENGIPDNCETDCNENGLLDWCDINDGTSEDVNEDGIPDECQCPADINASGVVDVEDLLLIISQWNLSGGTADINNDGIVDVTDLLIVVGNWGECE